MTTPIAHLINGQIVSCPQARLQDVFNPATGAVSGRVELASRATVETAIASAEAAFPAWRDTLPLKRAASSPASSACWRSAPTRSAPPSPQSTAR